jgi:hypothetical protein
LSIDQNLAVTGSWDTTLRGAPRPPSSACGRKLALKLAADYLIFISPNPVWDLDTYSNLTTLERPGEIGYIRCCQIDKSRGMVVSGSNDNSVKLWYATVSEYESQLGSAVSILDYARRKEG